MPEQTPRTRDVKAGDKFLVVGKLSTVETVARMLEHDSAAARQVMLTLGLIVPIKATPAPKPKERVAPTVRERIRITWLLLPMGRRVHAVRDGERRSVCGTQLGEGATWRVPTEHELADGAACLVCLERDYVRRSA